VNLNTSSLLHHVETHPGVECDHRGVEFDTPSLRVWNVTTRKWNSIPLRMWNVTTGKWNSIPLQMWNVTAGKWNSIPWVWNLTPFIPLLGVTPLLAFRELSSQSHTFPLQKILLRKNYDLVAQSFEFHFLSFPFMPPS